MKSDLMSSWIDHLSNPGRSNFEENQSLRERGMPFFASRPSRARFLMAFVCLSGVLSAAQAEPPLPLRQCTNKEGAANERIIACTTIIASAQASAKDRATAYFNRGGAIGRTGDLKNAISDFTQAINLAPDLTLAYFDRGYAYARLSRYGLAIADFDTAITQQPNYAPAYNFRALSYLNIGSLDRAISDASAGMGVDPAYPNSYATRGLAYGKECIFDRAITDLDQAIKLNPKFATAYNYRGLVYMSMRDLDRAAADFDQAIQLGPKLTAPYVNFGVLYAKKNELDRAISYYNQALAINPKHAFALMMRGAAYARKGAFAPAFADVDLAIQLNDKSALARYSRGHAKLLQQERLDEAIADFSDAIKLDPTFVNAYTARGLAYEARGDRDRAKSDFSAALALPIKCGGDTWAHDVAQQRLTASPGEPVRMAVSGETSISPMMDISFSDSEN